MSRGKPQKEFASRWAFEAFDGGPAFFERRMFGCLAAYVRGRLVMVLAEDPGERSYRGKRYPFDIWDGIMLPTERAHHESLMRDFKGLREHPVLGKWLYLPAAEENFEPLAREIAGRIARGDPRLGVDPDVRVPPGKRQRRKRGRAS